MTDELDKDALEAARNAYRDALRPMRTLRFSADDAGAMRAAIRAYLAVAGVHDHYCATDGCGRQATVWFERGGVGSHYCRECYMRIQALPSPPKEG